MKPRISLADPFERAITGLRWRCSAGSRWPYGYGATPREAFLMYMARVKYWRPLSRG